MKTSELKGAALNWAVNHVERLTGILAPVNYCGKWEHGGPIIEREGISINSHLDGYEWFARDYWGLNEQAAEKPLEAAMRCYVASKLGDTIDIPEGLT
jgi:hypothetical protein